MARENKPNFLKKDWHKLIRLGSTVKKKRKWRAAKGRHNKIRLSRKGHIGRPKIGWGEDKKTRNLVDGLKAIRVENLKQLQEISKGQGIVIAKVGKKKKNEIVKAANEMKIKILNKYLEKKE